MISFHTEEITLFANDSNGDGACAREVTRSRATGLSRGIARCLVAVDVAPDDCERLRVEEVRADDERVDDERCPLDERCDEELRDEPEEREGFPCDRVPLRDSLLMVLQLPLSSNDQIHQVDSPLQQQRRHQLCPP